MGRRIFDGEKTGKSFEGRERERIFEVKRAAKLGSEKNPAVLRVQTEERLNEITSILNERSWKATIELVPDQPEDTADLERLQNPQQPVTVEKKVGRNEPCPCGSGNKFKKCCGR